MSVRSRQTKVLAALLVSIAVGAIILKALGSNPPSAGAFCLSGYYRLDPVEKSILSQATQYQGRWSHIEIYYSDSGVPTKSGDTESCGSNRRILAPPPLLSSDRKTRGLDTRRETRCHFIVCNGRAGYDGQILPTENWQRQCQIIPEPNSILDTRYSILDSEQTIYISVIADDKAARPTDFQIKRAEALVEGLSRIFNIRPESIHYPDNWQ